MTSFGDRVPPSVQQLPLSQLPGSPIRKHLAMRNSRPPLPTDVVDFLDPTERSGLLGTLFGPCGNVCEGPLDVVRFSCDDVRNDPSLDKNEHGEGGERMAQLILSGLPAALIDVISHAVECQNKPVTTSRVLFNCVAEMNEHWYKILLLKVRGGNGAAELVSLSLLKTAIATIRLLGEMAEKAGRRKSRSNDGRGKSKRKGKSDDADESQLLVNATRLVARCLASPDSKLCRTTISMGIFQDTFKGLAHSARRGYDSGAVVSNYISRRALERILEVPPEEDRSLLKWLMSPTVYTALGGWIESGTQMRSPEVAARAASWKAVRALLAVGHRGSRGVMDPDELALKTRDLAAKLLNCRVEQRNGSLTRIPEIRLPPAAEDPLSPIVERLKPTCAACGSSGPGLKRCIGCKAAYYCDRGCQMSHRGAHKKECIERKEKMQMGQMLEALGDL